MKQLTAFWVFSTVFAINVFANMVVYAADPIIGPDVATVSCSGSYINYQTADGAIVKYRARWIASQYTCPAGHYLPKDHTNCLDEETICKPNHYCAGGTYPYSETVDDQGMEPCPNNMKSPVGSKSVNDCGHILHVGNSIIYLHKQNADTNKPRLAVKVGTQTYYANMTPGADGAKQMTSGSDTTKLHVKLGDTEYTVFDNSVFYQE